MWNLKALTQPIIFATHDFGSESHISKLAERMLALLSSMRIQPQPQPVCLFLNAVANDDADLWTITRLAPANDELGAIIGLLARSCYSLSITGCYLYSDDR